MNKQNNVSNVDNGVFIFLPSQIGEVPLSQKLPILVKKASTDKEAQTITKDWGPGELFKKIPREIKTLEKKKKNELFKK